MWPRLAVIFTLGALQGVMGWVMVASGLQDLVYVSHFRLAAHFMLAMVLLVALVWVGLEQLRPAASRGEPTNLVLGTRVLIGVFNLQLVFGAFMAGLKAAVFAPSWPTINGDWVPDIGAAWWNSPLVVHFAHRTLGYLLVLGVATWWWRTRRVLRSERHLALALVLMQVLLGITVTLRSMYRDELLVFGVMHQLTAVLLLIVLVGALFRLTPAGAQRPVPG
jgi:cytochrome c oxidase assembly protein subunit 15